VSTVVAPVVLAVAVLALLAAFGRSSGERGSTLQRPEAPVVTSARLLALRAADPAGGPGWGIRVVTTSQGLLCAQVGRVRHGELGQLGLDGAFHDDRRFHPLAANALPEVRGPGTAGDDVECVAPKETFAGQIEGLDRNAVTTPRASALPLSNRREISFGLLGPHALSITYLAGGRRLTRPVLAGLGAYLLVGQARRDRVPGSTGAAPGSDYADDLAPAGPTGALVAITYRYGRTVCRDNGSEAIKRCHLANRPLGPERTSSQSGG
jgi:hypothetical protein